MDFGLSLRETVEQYGLMAKKSLGQNFLLNRNITDKIIRLSLDKQGKQDFSDCNVFEIGPGPGGLTRSILDNLPQKLTVVEMDERCVQIMKALQSHVGVDMDVLHADAMQLDLSKLEQQPRQVVSNLPYNVSVPLLVGWLKEMPSFEALTLMFQKEVAERIMAPIKTKNYGRLSVLAQLTCKIDKLMDINPECFVPAPKIWSTVLLFTKADNIPAKKDLLRVEQLTSLAFGQRRKMIRQSLKQIEGLEKACDEIGISLTCRAEELSPNQYLALGQKL